MTRRVHPRLRSLATAALVALGLVMTGCSGSDAEVAPLAPTEEATATASPAATQPPGATSTAAPTSTPTATTSVPEPRFDDVIASTALIPIEELDRVEFSSVGGTAILPIEVPPQSEYGIGLSGRYQLGDRGMVFYYATGNRGGFWMRNTHIDLDIAFVDFDLQITDILQMEADTMTIHSPDALYLAAIEAPLGWYGTASIGPGDNVRFLFDIEAALAAAGDAD